MKQPTYQFLGHPEGGFFYARCNESRNIYILRSQEDVNTLVSEGARAVDEYDIIKVDADVIVAAHGVQGTQLVLDIIVQVYHYEKEVRQGRQTLINPDDLLFLLGKGYIQPQRVKLHKGLEPLRKILCTELMLSSNLFGDALDYP